MYDYGARFYMPDLGMFGTHDPLSELQFAYSPYSYVYGNPIRFTDPTGMVGEDPDPKKIYGPTGGKLIEEVVMTYKKPSPLSFMGISNMDAFHASQDRYATAIRGSKAALATEKFEKNLAFAMGTFGTGGSNLLASAGWATLDTYMSYQDEKTQGAVGKVQLMALFIQVRHGNISAAEHLLDDAAKQGDNITQALSSVLSEGDVLRIENAATRINKPITVVGSRASGTAGAYSDWDYVIEGGLNSKEWSKIKNSIPGAKSAMDNTPRNIDIFTGSVNRSKPHIIINPRK